MAVEVAQTLTGIRVVEIGSYIAGPMASMVLGDLGAEVVKIEDPRRGDETRAMPPFAGTDSAVFGAFNRSKRSVALDLGSAGGREAVRRLAAGADVVIQNLRPGLAAGLGLGFEDIAALNPRVVYCSISAFGEGEIGGTMPGLDAMIQAYSGIMASIGLPGDDTPVRVPAPLVDISTGVWAALGILAALLRRPTDPGPQLVDPSLLDTAMVLMSYQLAGHLATGVLPERLGSGNSAFAPYRAYRASDGWVFVGAGSERLFAKLCGLLGVPELVEDERFADVSRRIANRDALDDILAKHFETDTVSGWVTRLGAVGVPATPVNDLGQAIRSPVAGERNLLVHGRLRLPVDHGRTRPFARPPALGADTNAVLREAGFTDQEVAELTSEMSRRAKTEKHG